MSAGATPTNDPGRQGRPGAPTEAAPRSRGTLLITGGSGYLGSHLARLAAGQWQVAATYFSHPVHLSGCRAVPLDIRDSAAVAALVRSVRPQAVVHTAFDMTGPAMEEVIVAGTRHVAAAAAAVGAGLIHLSSDMVFDGERAPYTEDDAPQPITPYGRAKAQAEQAVAELHPAAAVVRMSLIYGFDPPDPRSRWVLDSVRGGRPITLFTDEIRSPVWVEQLAAALLELAAQAGSGGVWHIAGPQPLSRYDLGRRLARAFHLDAGGITPGLSRDSGLVRPRDLTLDVRRAQAALRTPLWGLDQVLAQHAPAPSVGPDA